MNQQSEPAAEAEPAVVVETVVAAPVSTGFSADAVIRVRSNEAERLKFEFLNRDISYVECIILLEAVRDAVLLEALNKIPKDKVRDLVDLKKLGIVMGDLKFAKSTGTPNG